MLVLGIEDPMKFQKGNTLSKSKIKDDEKHLAYAQLCDHVRGGYALESWRFRHSDYPQSKLSWKTMLAWVSANPLEYDIRDYELAKIDGFWFWEKAIVNHALAIKKGDTAGLQIIMRNRFGWDKESTINMSVEADFQKKVAEIRSIPIPQPSIPGAVTLQQRVA